MSCSPYVFTKNEFQIVNQFTKSLICFVFFKKLVLDNGIFKKRNANFHYIFSKKIAQNVHGIPPRNGLFKVQIQLRRNKINELFTTCFSLKKLIPIKIVLRRKTPIATKVQT